MGKYWYYFLFLAWFSYLIISSILLFTNGFLLSRTVITKNSTCISQMDIQCLKNNSIEKCENREYQFQKDVPNCISQKSKVILLIIDAFRYDFALYNEYLKYPLPYENKMPFINKLLTEGPRNNRLYKFIADPPTTTMQRLKALTTGSLPTFIDAGSNFASTEINEDNLLNQLVANKQNIVFLGDDTWLNLYPNYFLRSYPYPSFNVWDLDTVDIGITNNIYKELKEKDWNLLIAHYLGVDHCGHRYGPNHPEMTRKLEEMNSVIKNIVEHMDDDVILFIVGDHGMTTTGDHGGESIDEVTAALFVHSKLPLIDEHNNSVKQIDLIPTLATILGVPIPYSNLGMIIPSCLPLLDFNTTDLSEMASVIWANVQQMTLYIQDYSAITNTFDIKKIENFNTEYSTLRNQLEGRNINYNTFIKNCTKYMLALRKMCEKVWVQFDSFSMTRGLLLCFIPVFFVYTIVNGITSTKLSSIFSKYFIMFLYTTLIITIMSSAICYYMNITSNFLITTYFTSGVLAVFILGFTLIENWDTISMNWYETAQKHNWMNIVCRFILLVSTCAFFSNSFVIQECYVSLFLLITLLTVTIVDLCTSKALKILKNAKLVLKSNVKLKLFILTISFCTLIRFSMYYWQCREEQNCLEGFSLKQSNTNRTQLIFAVVSLGLIVTLSRMWLRHCGNLTAFNITVLFAQYAPTVITVCCGGFWILHNFTIEGRSKLLALWKADTLALISYSCIIIGFLMTYVQPLTVFIISKNINSHLYIQARIIPQLFQKIKTIFYEKNEKKEDIPIVCGLGSAYSAIFIIASVYILLLFALLLGNATAPSAVLLFFSAVIVLFISSITRYEKASNIDELFQVPTITLLAWVSLTVYFFYGTGHQPTFPNIVWEAAFVGTGGNFTNNYIPAILILINTFGTYIVMGFMLPMLQIAPFSIYAIISSLNTKKKSEQIDVTRGDIILYENDDTLLTNTFILSCKYLCCFSIRVFASMLAATIHCRHLMVWKVFAPKFIFEAVSMFVTIPSVLFGYILLIRVNSAVNKLVKRLDKGGR